jgi:hypothetical protein
MATERGTTINKLHTKTIGASSRIFFIIYLHGTSSSKDCFEASKTRGCQISSEETTRRARPI